MRWLLLLFLFSFPAEGSVTVLFNQGAGSPAISLTSPNGGSVKPGDTLTITWNTDGFGGDTIKIDMSRDGGASWITLFASTTNDGTEDWPVVLPSSRNGTFRVCGVTNSSICDQSDTIVRIRGSVLAAQ